MKPLSADAYSLRFLESILKEFNNEKSVVVTYNGKCFDSQILKTRCLMNGIKPPDYHHVDLLHPARRLWKKIIQDCSQASIETKILGIDRSGDIPGSLAPDIWFEFLKTGRTEKLTGICDHNVADITGLASILSAIISIASDPFNTNHNYDIEKIALKWRYFLRKQDSTLMNNDLLETGNKLMLYAAEKDYPRAVYVYIYDQMRLGNYSTALEFVNRGLNLYEKDSIWHKKLKRRKERLEKIINK